MLLNFFTFLLAFGLALYITPLAMRAALSLGAVARPDGVLRLQEEPVPYLGGVAVYLAALFALTMTVDFSPHMLGLLLGSTIVLMVGMIDDFGVMTARMKLFGQLIAVLALLKGGIYLELTIFDIRWPYDFPVLPMALSALWLTGVANAMNFLDIEDGLAGGTAVACCPALLAVAYLNGRADMAVFTAALFGAGLGFLFYNAPFPKARIYLGDAGSLFFGLALAALAMIGSYTGKNDLAAVCPVIILGVPVFELMVTMTARWRAGIPVWQGSPDHIAKRLQRAGLSKRTAVILHWATSLALGAIAVYIMLADIGGAMIAVGALAAAALAAFFLLIRVDTGAAKADEDP